LMLSWLLLANVDSSRGADCKCDLVKIHRSAERPPETEAS
jgi:hypothetical protein